MSKCKFKVGDKVIGNKKANKQYGITREGYIGTVTAITDETHMCLDDKFGVETEYFDLYKSKNKSEVNELNRYIINDGATILFWDDGTKTIVKRRKKDKFNKQLGFLTAYFQKNCGLSKNKANKFLDELKVQESTEKSK